MINDYYFLIQEMMTFKQRMIELIYNTQSLRPTEAESIETYILDDDRYEMLNSIMLTWYIGKYENKQEIIRKMIKNVFMCCCPKFGFISIPTPDPTDEQLSAMVEKYFTPKIEKLFKQGKKDKFDIDAEASKFIEMLKINKSVEEIKLMIYDIQSVLDV